MWRSTCEVPRRRRIESSDSCHVREEMAIAGSSREQTQQAAHPNIMVFQFSKAIVKRVQASTVA